jgi:hypothetical protein
MQAGDHKDILSNRISAGRKIRQEIYGSQAALGYSAIQSLEGSCLPIFKNLTIVEISNLTEEEFG